VVRVARGRLDVCVAHVRLRVLAQVGSGPLTRARLARDHTLPARVTSLVAGDRGVAARLNSASPAQSTAGCGRWSRCHGGAEPATPVSASFWELCQRRSRGASSPLDRVGFADSSLLASVLGSGVRRLHIRPHPVAERRRPLDHNERPTPGTGGMRASGEGQTVCHWFAKSPCRGCVVSLRRAFGPSGSRQSRP
jgi:hypothetical protein